MIEMMHINLNGFIAEITNKLDFRCASIISVSNLTV